MDGKKIITKTNAEIISIKKEYYEFKTFKLRLEKKINYSPGQFVMVWFKDSPEIKRAYTVSSYSKDKHFLSISVKLVSKGKLTANLFKAKTGDKLIIKGPYGLMKYEGEKKIVIIVGGCGVSLFFGLIDYFKKEKFPKEVILIYSSSSLKKFARKKELMQLQEENPSFKFFLTSPESKEKEKQLKKFNCLTTLIDKKFLKEKILFPKTKTYFLCGSYKMVKAIIKALNELGVKKENIKHEKWN